MTAVINHSYTNAFAISSSATAKANTGGKKFLRMVDKIAASKYFQQVIFVYRRM